MTDPIGSMTSVTWLAVGEVLSDYSLLKLLKYCGDIIDLITLTMMMNI